MEHFQPPIKLYRNAVNCRRLFLAGSIEMGLARPWQAEVIEKLNKEKGVILNPRRDDWDSSWMQTVDTPEFYEQVNWELDGIDISEYILFYFDPKTKSPVTLAELGYVLGKFPERAIVVCPSDFYRRGNVEIMCMRNGVLMFNSLDSAIVELKRRFNNDNHY